MISHQWIEGAGAEISAYTSMYAKERFRLVVLDGVEMPWASTGTNGMSRLGS